MRLRLAWLALGLSSMLILSAGVAAAQEGSSTVSKTPATGGGPKPAHDLSKPGEDVVPVAPKGEINTSGSDEGAGWDAAVDEAPAPTPLIGEERDAAVARINAYFNAITSLQGNFEQVDSSNKRATGRFYVLRPGKLRFDYASPSTLRIISDGHYLAIEDSELKTIEKYPLQSTPFRLLLSESVDLARDARIVGAEAAEGSLALTLEDKNRDASGQIKFFFETEPEVKLKQWVINDAQGLATTVTVTDLSPGRKVAADFFTAKASFQPFQ
jgi:outer membrane lipoprotein-sorting protein